VSESSLSVLDGSTFVVSDRHGDVIPGAGHELGFFSEDTRFISRWILRIADVPLQLLSLNQGSHFDAQFFLTPTLAPEEQAPWSIIRHRLVDHVWMEEITFTNHLHQVSQITLSLEADTDFADLFEVKDVAIPQRAIDFSHDERSLTLAYANGEFHRSVTVSASAPATITRTGFSYALSLAPGECWTTTFTVAPSASQPGARFTARAPRGSLETVCRARSEELEKWLARAPALEAENPDIARTYRASIGDLAALRMHPDLNHGATLPAAGLPWFMALFGRDSLITSFQTLPYLPELAATTLRALAARQATERDDFHEREPGKILHELRFGELTFTGQRPHSPYYGSADATPLFLILLSEYHRWTGDDALVGELEAHARAALSWITDSGDADGDGYVEYERRNHTSGLVNQCWKDSWDSMQFADGTLATGPIATCEIQGYVYDAYRRSARLAREVWGDVGLGARLEQRASDLRAQFQRDFWMPERGAHALALDGHKRQVNSLTSNIGHLLWSGIVADAEAAMIAQRLLEPALYSGWGVRTLGAQEGGYNPLGYHTGTVWPHENSLIVAGLARYGHHEEADSIAAAMLSAAVFFEHRLPEVFAGFPIGLTTVPVAFPTASRPQAWAAGTPLQLLSTMLSLAPEDAHAEVELPGRSGHVMLQRDRDPRRSPPTPTME
jgi:glycogen debranching enzyme